MSIVYESLSGVSQVFFVKDETGVFLTSVDVYFSSKDDTAPITLEIRNVVSGIPGNVTIPFSKVTLEPNNVSVSSDASVATKFTFPSPVYLSGPQQQSFRDNASSSQQAQAYAITVTSNSSKYNVFVAEQGKPSLNDGSIFSNSPGTVGNYFRAQNAATWVPSALETLKYTVYRANFANEGLVRFFNSSTSQNTGTISVTGQNQFTPLDKRIVVGLGSTGISSNVAIGVSIVQGSATATLTGLGASVGIATVYNVGTGYTNGTFTGVNLITETGFGQGAVATIGVVNSGIATVTITSSGSGYAAGDVLGVGTVGQNIGFGGKVLVETVGLTNSLKLSNVQGQFQVGLTTVKYINSSGITTTIAENTGVGITISSIVEDQVYDGLHIKVNHLNHGMHSQENLVNISQFRPLNTQIHSKLSVDLNVGETTLNVDSTNGFETFEGLPVGTGNTGYVIIGKEVVGYTTYSSTTLGTLTRQIDGTDTQPFLTGAYVYKYEFNGMSLRRINKTHNFANVDVDNHPITLDSYYIKIDNSTSGKDRTNDLYFKDSLASGQSGTTISQNIPYEEMLTKIKSITPSKTNIESKVRTFTGTSISGNENSFQDAGFQDFPLNMPVYFDSPRVVASSTNESYFALPSPGNRSLELDFYMSSTDSRVSPVIDLDEASVILTTNRLNKPVSDFATDDNVRSLNNDPHESVYISKLIELKIPANSLKVFLTAAQSTSSDIRMFYRIFRPDIQSINYEPFPGFSNYSVGQDGIKRVIDSSLNDGSPDKKHLQESRNTLQDYEFSVDDLPDFTGFSIKIIMAGSNQALPPYLQTLRAIATKKPSI